MSRRLRTLMIAGTAVALAAFGVYWYALRRDPGDLRLRAFVHSKPPFPIVFTSRTEPSSFAAAAPEGEEFRYPGKHLWTAREGRLRLLTPYGTVHELTWGKPLPDGGTLIDVMSPSVSQDGKTILFAGRKGGDDAGHFRLYEVSVDGSGLRPLTGGSEDAGAVAVPPMRYRPDGSMMPDTERRRIDYDDVDPVELRSEPREILFASSRTPDLGRDHARRSTTLWVLHPDGRKTPASANRNNDRWPFVMSSGYAAFSLWSRNREVVTADRTDIRPYDPAIESASQPTDQWLGAFVRISTSGHFGMLVKPNTPVWRPRPLFNGRIAFMTGSSPDLRVAQCEPGLIAGAPSAAVGELPKQKDTRLRWGPDRDAAGRALALATPSPCPPDEMVLSAAPIETGDASPRPGSFGIYLASTDWPDQDAPASIESANLRLLFDDPDLVDAEPVAVYPRKVESPPTGTASPGAPAMGVKLASGSPYDGPFGSVFATGLYSSMMNDLPGQTTDAGAGPIFGPPPEGAIDRLKVYASRRDRFDDPVRPRVPGAWEFLLELPATDRAAGGVPADSPTVLAGFGKDGKVVRWTTAAKDSSGKSAMFYALAGDHYSLTIAGGRHFCVGCHPGHSGITHAQHRHAEQRAD